VRVEVAYAGKENLPIDPEITSHLHQLRDLLQLSG
jgi:hypothetical protein